VKTLTGDRKVTLAIHTT